MPARPPISAIVARPTSARPRSSSSCASSSARPTKTRLMLSVAGVEASSGKRGGRVTLVEAPQHLLEVVGQRGGAAVAGFRRLGQQAQDDLADDRRRHRARRERRGIAGHVRSQQGAEVGVEEWRRASEQLVRQAAEAVEVGAGVDRGHDDAGLLRRHVVRRAGRRRGAGAGRGRQPEVDEQRARGARRQRPGGAVGAQLEQHVAGLDVAVG
jgi:hypothetical protein